MLENHFHVRGRHCSGAYRPVNTVWVDVGYLMLAKGNSAFHFLSLLLKSKMMDACMQTLTGKAPYTDPVGTLLRISQHRDHEIAELVYCFVFHVNPTLQQINKILSPSSEVSKLALLLIIFNYAFGEIVQQKHYMHTNTSTHHM